MAGGLNLYGFAGGDPINFWDPFGLSPEDDDDDKSVIQQAFQKLKKAIGGALDKVLGDVLATVDKVTGQPAGTTGASIVNGVLASDPSLSAVLCAAAARAWIVASRLPPCSARAC